MRTTAVTELAGLAPRAPSLRSFGRVVAAAGLLLLAGCAHLPFRRQPQPPGHTTLSSPLITLPAKTIGNFLVIETKWDRYGPYHFVIDTGSANTLLSPTLVRRYGELQEDGPKVHVASAEGDLIDLPTASLKKFNLGGARFEDVQVLVYDCAELSAHLGVKIDGILGYPLFRDTRLTLDYPHDRVLLQPPDTTSLAAGTAISADDSNKTPVVHVQIGDRSLLVLLDSGSDATFSLNPVGLDAKYAAAPRPGATVGTIAGDHPQQIGRLAETVSIAGYALEDPVVDLTDELSAIGGGILRYFTVTFDPDHDRVTFLRDSHAPIVLPARRSAGVSFSKTPAYWRVAGVIPNSPAAAAGIQLGDLVTRINGETVSKWNLTRFEQYLTTANDVTLTFLFGTKEIEKRVGIFDLVP